MVAISNLSFAHPGSPLLSFADWGVGESETCLILGNSGSGKTTLLHLIAGFLRPASGAIHIAGVEMTALRNSALDQFRGKTLGFVFQKPHLIQALNVMDNLLLSQRLAGLHPDSAAVRQVLDSLGIGDKSTAPIHTLSQGQAQRVTIARAVLHRPRVILADEPTSSLDDTSASQVFDLLSEQARIHGAALIIATHDQRLKEKVNIRIQL
jgi:putative ABC transport system ATP-binding protein